MKNETRKKLEDKVLLGLRWSMAEEYFTSKDNREELMNNRYIVEVSSPVPDLLNK